MCDNLVDCLTVDDAFSLRQLLAKADEAIIINLHSLAYQTICDGSYQCLDVILNHRTFDVYLPFTVENACLPLLHHAIRLGDLHACKLLLDNGVHPLVCAGSCHLIGHDQTDDSSSADPLCEDAVHFALHYAAASNRRNTIAVLLQTHFYAFVASLMEVCNKTDTDRLKQLLPEDLRLRCCFSILCTGDSVRNSSSHSSPVSNNLFGSLSTVVGETNSTWNALSGSGISTQAMASAVALGSGSVRLGKRLLSVTSDTAVGVFSSFTKLLTGSAFSTPADGSPENLLNRDELSSWFKICSDRLLLLCVHRNFTTGLQRLLQLGVHIRPVSLANSSLRPREVSVQMASASTCRLFVQDDILSRPNHTQSLVRPWSDSGEEDMDSTIHAAVRFGRTDLVKLILELNPVSSRLSLPTPGLGALPLHTAVAWGHLDCLRVLLHQSTSSSNKPTAKADRSTTDTSQSCSLEMPGDLNEPTLVNQSYSCRVDGLPAVYEFPFCLDQMDSYGLTPFLLATINGHTDIVRELLQFEVPVERLPGQYEWSSPQCIGVDPLDLSCSPQPSETEVELPERSQLPSPRHSACPINLKRTVSACWEWNYQDQSVAAPCAPNSRLIVNPSSRHCQDNISSICCQFNALHLAVLSGNVEIVKLFLDGYFSAEVNLAAGRCVHTVNEWTDGVSNPGSRYDVALTPLGLTCYLAELHPKVAYDIANILLDAGAFDEAQAVFRHSLQRGHYRLAGLLLTKHAIAPVSPIGGLHGLHLNLSHKCIGPNIIPPSMWFLLNGLITEWIIRMTGNVHCGLSFTALSSITKISLSHCGLQVLPLCLLYDLPHLQEVDLSRNHITDLPSEIPYPRNQGIEVASSLTYLDISHNNLRSIPPWLFGITHQTPTSPAASERRTRSLDRFSSASHGHLHIFSSITHLMLSNNQLVVLPGEMWLSRTLLFLDVSWNSLKYLPPLPERLSHTTSCRSTSLPMLNLHSSTALTEFGIEPSTVICKPDVSNFVPNALSSVFCFSTAATPLSDRTGLAASFIRPATSKSSLRYLWLQHNKLRTLIPQRIGRSKHSIDASRSELHPLCVSLGRLAPRLQHLDASHNRLRIVPPCNFFPASLLHLDLSHNRIVDLWCSAVNRPVSKSKLCECTSKRQGFPQRLNSSSSSNTPSSEQEFRLTIFSAEHYGKQTFPSLEHLNFRGNRLKTFDPSVDHSPLAKSRHRSSLTQLNLCSEREPTRSGVSSSSLILFPSLKTLDLGDNPYLKELPASVTDLHSLRQLFLDGCTSLNTLPADLWQLSELHTLYLHQTPFDLYIRQAPALPNNVGENSSSLPTVCSSDPNTMQSMLSKFKLISHRSHPNTNVRLMVVGPRGVGKTSLVQLLHAVEEHSEDDWQMWKKLKRPRGFRSRIRSRSFGPRPSTDSSGELTELSFETTSDPSPVVSVGRLVVHRLPEVDANSSASQSELSRNWCEEVTFTVWDIGDSNQSPMLAWERTGVSNQGPPVANILSSDTMTLIEQSLYCPSSVFLVVWRVSDGVAGLNQATQWLMDIQSKVRTAPVILVGTHVDGLQPDSSGGGRGILRNPRSSNSTMIPFTPEFIHSLVRTRFSTSTDLSSFGLPRLYGHVMLDLRPQSNGNLRTQLMDLLTVVHKAANTIQVSSRSASAMMLGSVLGPRPSLRLLGLALPEFYRQALVCTRQITAELHHTLQIPVLSRDKFLFQLHKRLCQQPDPPPIPITSELPLGSTDNDSNSSNPAVPPALLSTRSRGFQSTAESQAVLVFLNYFGHVLHFNDPALSPFVFLSPAWLIQLLLRLFTRLHRTRRINTAVIRRRNTSDATTRDQLPVVDEPMSSSELPWLQSPSSNTAIITETELCDLVVQCLDKPNHQIDRTDFEITTLLEAIVPLLLKLELALRLDDKHVLLPSLLSTRSVRSQQLVSYASPALGQEPSMGACAPARVIRKSWNDLLGAKDSSDAGQLERNSNMSDRSTSLCQLSEITSQTRQVLASGRRCAVRHKTPRPSLAVSWSVQTVASEEIVRLYTMAYIPTGFWTRLAARFLNDQSLHNICSKVYHVPQSMDNSPNESKLETAKPEWTLWKHGMRLSLANGLIGLARLQQFTKANCALHRPYWLSGPRGRNGSPGRKRPCASNWFTDEWEEVAAVEGEDALAEPVQPNSGIIPDQVAYRSGVVGAARNTYHDRDVRLVRWLPSTDSNELKPLILATSNEEPTGIQPHTASNFKIQSDGRLISEKFDGLQTTCLIELYIPCHRLIRRRHPSNVWSRSPQRLHNTNSVPDIRIDPFDYVRPNREAIAQLLTKLVDHIDRLLEDWYPDLGVRFRQSTEGIYLVDRIIPCCSCLCARASPAAESRRKSSSKRRSKHDRAISEASLLHTTSQSDSLVDLRTDRCSDEDQSTNKRSCSVNQNPFTIRRSASYNQLDRMDPTSVVVGLSSTEHHLTVQQRTAKEARRKRFSRRSHSAEAELSSTDGEDERQLYAIRLSEYIHWLIMHPQSSSTSTSRTDLLRLPADRSLLYCPIHPSTPFQAPDLHFEDVKRMLMVPSDSVRLFKFLGRGAFGSVFSGQYTKETSGTKPRRTVDVAVKLTTPIHPKLQESRSYLESSASDRISELVQLKGTDNAQLREALALYRQEQRRWSDNSVEACTTAYLEIRAELNVLERIRGPDTLSKSSRKFQSPKPKVSKSQAVLGPCSSRFAAAYQIRKRALGQVLTNKEEIQEVDQSTINQHRPTLPPYLLLCLGLLSPNPLGLLMPLAPKGTLAAYVKLLADCSRLSDQAEPCDPQSDIHCWHPMHPLTMISIIHQVSTALAHLHRMCIVHRDVKSDNMLVWALPALPSGIGGVSNDDPRLVHIVLIDFGASQHTSPSDGYRGYVGTAGYMAPEILRHLGEETYTEKVDIYSLAIMMCELIKLGPAYRQSPSTRFDMVQRVLADKRPEIPIYYTSRCPIHILELMSLCWSSEPVERPSAHAISQLTAPWWSPELIDTAWLHGFHQQATRNEMASDQSQEGSHHVPISFVPHIRTAHRLDSLDVVTCVLVDPLQNLWLGGYRCRSGENSPFSNDPVEEPSEKIGLLLMLPLGLYTQELSSGSEKARLVDRYSTRVNCAWPIGWSKLGFGNISKLAIDTRKWLQTNGSLPGAPNNFSWPEALCVTSGFSTQSNQFLVNCLTSGGDLIVYRYPQLDCVMRTRLYKASPQSEHPFPVRPWNFEPLLSSFGERESCPTRVFAANAKPTEHMDTGGSYELVALLNPTTIVLVHMCVNDTDLEQCSRVRFCGYSVVETTDVIIYCGLSLSEISTPQFWFGQSNGHISCYSCDWIKSTERKKSGQTTQLVLRFLESWPAAPGCCTEQSRVTTLLREPGNQEAAQPMEHEQDVRVWSYLHPEHTLTCWSAIRRTAWRTISLATAFTTPLSTPAASSGLQQERIHTGSLSAIRQMKWLAPSMLLLLTECGDLMHVDLQDANPSSRGSLVLRYHTKPMSPNECGALLLVNIDGAQHEQGTQPFLLFTVHRGYRNPLATIVHAKNPKHDAVKSGYIDQDHFYLVSLFCDRYLFPQQRL